MDDSSKGRHARERKIVATCYMGQSDLQPLDIYASPRWYIAPSQVGKYVHCAAGTHRTRYYEHGYREQ